MAYGDDGKNLTPLDAGSIDDFDTSLEGYELPSLAADPDDEEEGEAVANFGNLNSMLASAAAQQDQEPTSPNASSLNSFDFGTVQSALNQQSAQSNQSSFGTTNQGQSPFGNLEQMLNNRSEHLNNGAPQQDVSPLQNISFDDMSFNLTDQQVVNDDDDYTEEDRSGHSKKPVFKIIGIGIAVVVVLIAVSGFFKSKDKDSQLVEQEQTEQQEQIVEQTEQTVEQTEQTVEQPEQSVEESTEEGDNSTQDIVDNVTDGDIQIEQRGKLLTFNSMKYANKIVYKDTFFVNKFVEMRGGALMPKFKGKAKKLGSVIEFYVPMKTYNKFTNGVEVSIEYRAVFVDGEVYVTDVQLAD